LNSTFPLFWMLYAFFWVIPRRLNFKCGRFGTLCLFHIHSLCNRLESRAVWLGYNLFHDQTWCTARQMWQGECIWSVIRMFHKISELIPTIFQKYPINAAIRHLWWGTNTPKFLLFKYKSIGCSYLEITTGPDISWSDTTWVETVLGEIGFRRDYPPVDVLHTCMFTIYTGV
jgi:hypothetical protein